MKNLFILAAASLLSTFILAAPAVVGSDGLAILKEAPEGAETNGGYIVVLKDDADSQGQVSALGLGIDLPLLDGNVVSHVFDNNLKGFAGKFDAATLKKIRQNPNVAYVEPDSIMRASVLQNQASYGLAISSQKARIPSFSKMTKYYYRAGAGSGVTAYIIDTGIYAQHSEFGKRAKLIANFVSNSADTDENGHGTHVAGTIGGKTFGIAKNVTLAGIKVLDYDGSGSTSTVISGINYAVRHCSGKCVINMSLGGIFVNALNQAVENAIAAGVTVVAASGNNGGNACLVSPASARGAIAVSAIDFGYGRPGFANFGRCVTLFAPGVDIESAWLGAPDSTRFLSGTSMASPHIAGIAAYYLGFGAASTPAGVEALLIKNSQIGLVSNRFGTPDRIGNNGFFLKKK